MAKYWQPSSELIEASKAFRAKQSESRSLMGGNKLSPSPRKSLNGDFVLNSFSDSSPFQSPIETSKNKKVLSSVKTFYGKKERCNFKVAKGLGSQSTDKSASSIPKSPIFTSNEGFKSLTKKVQNKEDSPILKSNVFPNNKSSLISSVSGKPDEDSSSNPSVKRILQFTIQSSESSLQEKNEIQGDENRRSPIFVIAEKVPSHRVGFPNLHQTCYLNAILQSLLAQPSLVRNLLDLKFAEEEKDTEKTQLLKSFYDLTVNKERGEQRKARDEILKLKNILAHLDSTFQGDTMQDADEFLLKFCDTIQEQCKTLKGFAAGDIDPISANIEYKTEETLICSNCKKKKQSVVRDIICKLVRPVLEKKSSIGYLLQKTFSESQITDWKCESCGLTSKASSVIRFKALPRVLILYLPRSDFEYNRVVKSCKNQSIVEISQCLNLSCILDPEFSSPKSFSFKRPSDDEAQSEEDEPPRKYLHTESLPETPEKLKNLSHEQIGKLNDEDSLALAIRQSLKDSSLLSEEEQLQVALDESMNDIYSHHSDSHVTHHSNDDNDAEEIFTSPCDGDGDNPISMYRLTGVVTHLGSSVSSGHYIADIYRLDKKTWYRYNDMDVYKRDWESVSHGENTRNGYLFLYTHCQLIPS